MTTHIVWTYVDHLDAEGKVMFYERGKPYRALSLSDVLGPGNHTWSDFKVFAATRPTWAPIEDPELIEPASVEEDPVGWFKAATARIAAKRPADPTHEPKRPPLAYFSEAKRFDAFPGFITETGCVNGAGHRIGGVSPFRDLSLDGCESFRAPKAL